MSVWDTYGMKTDIILAKNWIQTLKEGYGNRFDEFLTFFWKGVGYMTTFHQHQRASGAGRTIQEKNWKNMEKNKKLRCLSDWWLLLESSWGSLGGHVAPK